MVTATQSSNEQSFDTQGERFNEILDQIGFRAGHGRISHLQMFLQEHEPNIFPDINYTTVRAWFRDTAPPMRKVEIIIDCLSRVYEFHHDTSLIKTWWKVGGRYPFLDTYKEEGISEEGLSYQITTLTEQVLGSDIEDHRIEDVKNRVMEFAKDYANPDKTHCPDEVLEILINKWIR